MAGVFPGGMIVLLDEIPLIDDDNAALGFFLNEPGYFHILLRDPLPRIDEQ